MQLGPSSIGNSFRGRFATSTVFATAHKYLLGIPADEVRVDRRGFHATNEVARRLERVGSSFVEGYTLGLQYDDCDELGCALDGFEAEWRGFAYEGAAMALALLDRLSLRRRSRWQRFAAGRGYAHEYMVHVGAGWAIARLPWLRRNLESAVRGFDPLLSWLVVDGYGFHEGYFYWRRYAGGRTKGKLDGYFQRAFDQGLGRSLWFVHGTSVERIAAAIETFPEDRRSDLWSGTGLACAYAGGASEQEVLRLRKTCGAFLPQVAQGIAFAAKARERAGNPTAHTDMASRAILGVPAVEAARLTDRALIDLPVDGAVPAYETWRSRVRSEFARQSSFAT